jgi:hypothetical protein
MTRSAIVHLAFAVLLATACNRDEKPPYYQPRSPDASELESTDAGVLDATSAEVLDAAMKPDDSGSQPPPRHVSQSCADFSSDVVHARGMGSLTELSVDGMEHTVCGTIPSAASVARIRQTDGKLLYLLKGFLYQFVPDDQTQGTSSGSPGDNDLKLTVPNNCPDPPASTEGPFADFRLKPNGLIVYYCKYPDDGKHRSYYDEAGNEIGNWPIIVSRVGIDNDGRMLQADRVIRQQNNSVALTTHIKTNDYETLKISGPSECLAAAPIFAFRELPKGFLIATRNFCGIQLWTVTRTAITIKAYYVHAPTEFEVLSDPLGYGQLAVDGTLYFQKNLRLARGWELACPATICALTPHAKQADPINMVPITTPRPIPWALWDMTDQNRQTGTDIVH